MFPGPLPGPWRSNATVREPQQIHRWKALKHPPGRHKRSVTRCLAPEVINISLVSRATFLVEAPETCPALMNLSLQSCTSHPSNLTSDLRQEMGWALGGKICNSHQH